MNSRYLTKEKIKELKQYIISVLPEKNIITLRKILGESGYECLTDNIHKNITNYRSFLWKQFENKRPEKWKQMLRLRSENGTHEYEILDMFDTFIEEEYKNEIGVLWTTNLYLINQKINGFDGFTKRHNVEPLYITEIIETDNIDDLLNSKYDKSNVDKKLLERTEKIKKNIDDFYCGVNHNIFHKSMIEYMTSGDETNLHNMLNEIVR